MREAVFAFRRAFAVIAPPPSDAKRLPSTSRYFDDAFIADISGSTSTDITSADAAPDISAGWLPFSA